MNYSKTIDYKGFPLTVNFDFSFGDKGVHTYSNGDPGYPPTDDEFEINSVELGPYDITDLVYDQLDAIEQAIIDQSKED